MSPKYAYPRGLFEQIALDVVLARHRNFRRDALACIENLNPPLRVLGKENIPQRVPCVVTVNHYHREGFGAQWFALAISASIPKDVHWVMTGEFTYPEKWYESFGSMGSRILLNRLAHVYDFTTMPPMPPREKDVAARAAAVRAVLEYVRRTHNPILGLAPEGYDPIGPAGVLTRPSSGFGRFALLLARAGLPFISVGVYEADGIFTITFGQAYELQVQQNLSVNEKDRQAAQLVMKNIAQLLPVKLRGEFA